jgi:hypothetical protein
MRRRPRRRRGGFVYHHIAHIYVRRYIYTHSSTEPRRGREYTNRTMRVAAGLLHVALAPVVALGFDPEWLRPRYHYANKLDGPGNYGVSAERLCAQKSPALRLPDISACCRWLLTHLPRHPPGWHGLGCTQAGHVLRDTNTHRAGAMFVRRSATSRTPFF